MAVVILNHKVENYQKWKPIYDRDVERRKKADLKEIICGQKDGEPNNVYMVFEAGDPAKVRDMLKDPELKEVMDEAGVISKPDMIVVEE